MEFENGNIVSQGLKIDEVKKRSIRGVAVLTGRTILLNAISLVVVGFLTVFLDPKDLGIFWIVSAVVNFLAYFSDIGLAASLIQKKENLTEKDLNSTFIVQQIIVIGLLLLLYLFTPLIRNYYQLEGSAVFLIYALGFSLLLSSLKTIPSILIERNLEFEKLVIPQILENLFYNSTALFFAWRGYGVMSFTYAVLARAVVGFIAIYLLKPWYPKLMFGIKNIKGLLRFGLPYQINTLLAVVKDDGMTSILGGILGPIGMGYLGWAQKWAYTPLRLFMDNVLKVTFPAFSRMQDDRKQLENAVTRSIFFVCFLVFPSVIGLIVLTPSLIQIIPRYEKWWPAYIPLILISINALFGSATTQLTNLLNSTGKIKTTFKLMVMWTSLTWILVPILSINYGFVGASFGYALVGVSSIIAIVIAKKHVNFSIVDSIMKPFLGSILMGVFLYLIYRFSVPSIRIVFIEICVGVLFYFTFLYLLTGNRVMGDIKKIFKSYFKKYAD